SYLPCMGWALLVGAAAAGRSSGSAVIRGVLVLWILGLGLLTWQQSLVWHDPISLWHHAVTVTPHSRGAHANLARAHAAAGWPAGAIAEWDETRRLSSRTAPFDVIVGELAERAGVAPFAAARFRDALRESPGLGAACEGLGRVDPSARPAAGCSRP